MMKCHFKLTLSLVFTGIVLLVNNVHCYPAEASGTKTNESTTTAKSVRHPNYVRLLNRKSNETVENKNGKSGAELLSNLPRDRNLTADEIKSIIPYLEFSTERSSIFGSSSDRSSSSTSSSRPRGIAGIFNLLMGPINALRSFANRNNNNNNNFDTSSSSSGFKLNYANYSNNNKNGTSSNSISNRSSGTSAKNSTTTTAKSSPAPANNLLAGPGRFLAGMMKTVQSMTATFADMIMSFMRLFNFNNLNLNRNTNRNY